MFEVRFTLSAIKADGLRHLAFDNNERCNYETYEEAMEMYAAVLKNNPPNRINDIVGKDLRVTPVECYRGGSSTATILSSKCFARRCDVTGKGMNEGYCIDEGSYYASNEEAANELVKQFDCKDYNDAYESGIAYWTQWEDEDDKNYIMVGNFLIDF